MQVPLGDTVPPPPRSRFKLKTCPTNSLDATEERYFGCATRHSEILLQCVSGKPDYYKKRRLPIQNQSGGCVLSITNPPRQPEVPQLPLHEHGVSILGTFLQSKHNSTCVNSPGSHCGGLSPSSRHICTTLHDWLVHHPATQLLSQDRSAEMLGLVGFKRTVSKFELEPVKDIQFLGVSTVPGSGQGCSPRFHGLGDSSTRYNLSSTLWV